MAHLSLSLYMLLARIAILIVRRQNEPSHLTRALSIMALDLAHEGKEDRKDIPITELHRHPNLDEFLRRTETAIIGVKITEYILPLFDRLERIELEGGSRR